MMAATVPGEVEEVNMPRVEERLRDITDVFHEIHLKKVTEQLVPHLRISLQYRDVGSTDVLHGS